MTTSKQGKQNRASQESDGAATVSKASQQQAANTKSAQMERQGDGFVSPAKSAGVSPTWGEEWRHECEVRFALSLPDKSDKRKKGWAAVSKRELLEGILQKRGNLAYERLRKDMIKRWKK